MADVDRFVMQWGLDEGSHASLLGLPPELQKKVVSSFEPKENTKDVNKLLDGFIRSLQSDYVPGTKSGSLEGDHSDENCAAWCIDQGLNDACLVALLALDPEHRLEAMARFAPNNTTKNVVGLFLGFLRSVQNGPPPGISVQSSGESSHLSNSDQQACADWCETLGLDEGCLDALLALPYEESIKITNEFAPKPGTKDPVGLFHAFVKSVTSGGGKGGKGGKGAVKGAALNHSQYGSRGWYNGPSEEELVGFLQAHGLDETSATLLEQQAPETQVRIIQEFAPKYGTKDVNGLFAGFIRSVSASQGKGAPPMSTSRGKGGPRAEELIAFLQTHGLDTSSAALLEQQAPDIQLRLMQEFLPKPGTKNANGLFAAFVRSMSAAPGKGAQSGKGAQMYTSQAKGGPRTGELIAFFADTWA